MTNLNAERSRFAWPAGVVEKYGLPPPVAHPSSEIQTGVRPSPRRRITRRMRVSSPSTPRASSEYGWMATASK